jgi:hypothetical protein
MLLSCGVELELEGDLLKFMNCVHTFWIRQSVTEAAKLVEGLGTIPPYIS